MMMSAEFQLMYCLDFKAHLWDASDLHFLQTENILLLPAHMRIQRL